MGILRSDEENLYDIVYDQTVSRDSEVTFGRAMSSFEVHLIACIDVALDGDIFGVLASNEFQLAKPLRLKKGYRAPCKRLINHYNTSRMWTLCDAMKKSSDIMQAIHFERDRQWLLLMLKAK